MLNTKDLQNKILFFLLFILLCRDLFSQNFAWAKNMHGTEIGIGSAITITNPGNIFTAGGFRGTVDFDPSAGTYNITSTGTISDIFVSKMDANGNFIWAKRMGGNRSAAAYSIAVDDSGNVYTTGWFDGTVDFDPGIGIFNLTSPGVTEDNFILKLDSSGNFVWAKSFLGNIVLGWSIAVDVSGNVYTTGIYTGTVDFDPDAGVYNLKAPANSVFISKLDNSGKLIWAKSLDGKNLTESLSIAVDGSGNVYTTGYFEDSIDCDPGVNIYNLISNGGDDIFISKLNASGNFVWAKKIGGLGNDEAHSIIVDSLKNTYYIGAFTNTVDFDPGTALHLLTASGGVDAFILKLDSNGNFKWVNKIGGSSGLAVGYSVVTDKSLNVYVSGGLVGTVYCNTSSGIDTLISAAKEDIFIAKIDSSGNFLWTKKIGGNGVDRAYSIVLDKLENLYITGCFQATVDFDPGPGTFNLNADSGVFDIYIMKLCIPPSPSGAITGSKSVCLGATKIYNINSVTGATGYKWTVPNGAVINSGQGGTSINVTFGINSGNIIVTPTNNCSDGFPDTLAIKVNLPPTVGLIVSPSVTVCDGSYITLKGTGASTYTWSGGVPDGVPFIISTTKTFTVIGIDTNGCTNIDSITIKVIPFPKKITQNKYYVCPEKIVTITAENNGLKYLWNTNDTTQKIIVAQGKYVVKISNQQCFIYDTVEVLNFTTLKPVILIQNNQLTSTKGNTYKWFNADTLILNESKQQFAPKHNGYYKVLITDSNDCEAISDSIYFERIFKEIKIYPNPSNGKFTIEIPRSIEWKSISIYDVIGRELQLNYSFKEGLVELNLENYASGGYIILIKDAAGKEWVRKVVKK